MLDFIISCIESGWIEVNLDNGKNNIDLCASYIYDGIKELIISTTLLLENNIISVCKWESDEEQYRWIFMTKNSSMSLRIIWFNQAFSNADDSSGKIIFEAEENLFKFSRKIISEIQKYLDEYGKNYYEKQWHYAFPIEELKRLRNSLKNKWQKEKNNF